MHNASFENLDSSGQLFDGWTLSATAYSGSTGDATLGQFAWATDGMYSALVNVVVTGGGSIVADVVTDSTNITLVTANQPYKLSVDYNMVVGGATAAIVCDFYTDAAATIPSSTVSLTPASQALTVGQTGTLTGTITVPSDAVSMLVSLRTTATTSCVIAWDNLRLVRATPGSDPTPPPAPTPTALTVKYGGLLCQWTESPSSNLASFVVVVKQGGSTIYTSPPIKVQSPIATTTYSYNYSINASVVGDGTYQFNVTAYNGLGIASGTSADYPGTPTHIDAGSGFAGALNSNSGTTLTASSMNLPSVATGFNLGGSSTIVSNNGPKQPGLLLNSGYEFWNSGTASPNNPDNWTITGAGSWAREGTIIQAGTYSVNLVPNVAATLTMTSDKVAVTAGVPYYLTGYIYTASASATGVNPSVKWYDATGTLLSTSSYGSFATSATTWQQYLISSVVPSAIAPANAVAATVQIPSARGVQTYWDAITFTNQVPGETVNVGGLTGTSGAGFVAASTNDITAGTGLTNVTSKLNAAAGLQSGALNLPSVATGFNTSGTSAQITNNGVKQPGKLLNGAFEFWSNGITNPANPDNWTVTGTGTWGREASTYLEGKYSLRLAPSSGTMTATSDLVGAIDSEYFGLKCYVDGASGTPSANIDWYDNTGTNIGTFGVSLTNAGFWQPLEVRRLAPTGTVAAKIRLVSASAVTTYFDFCSFDICLDGVQLNPTINLGSASTLTATNVTATGTLTGGGAILTGGIAQSGAGTNSFTATGVTGGLTTDTLSVTSTSSYTGVATFSGKIAANGNISLASNLTQTSGSNTLFATTMGSAATAATQFAVDASGNVAAGGSTTATFNGNVTLAKGATVTASGGALTLNNNNISQSSNSGNTLGPTTFSGTVAHGSQNISQSGNSGNTLGATTFSGTVAHGTQNISQSGNSGNTFGASTFSGTVTGTSGIGISGAASTFGSSGTAATQFSISSAGVVTWNGLDASLPLNGAQLIKLQPNGTALTDSGTPNPKSINSITETDLSPTNASTSRLTFNRDPTYDLLVVVSLEIELHMAYSGGSDGGYIVITDSSNNYQGQGLGTGNECRALMRAPAGYFRFAFTRVCKVTAGAGTEYFKVRWACFNVNTTMTCVTNDANVDPKWNVLSVTRA